MAVAAWGLTNVVLVGLALFTGVAQGVQLLINRAASKADQAAVRLYLRYGMKVSLLLATGLYLGLLLFKYPVTGFFNTDQDPLLIN